MKILYIITSIGRKQGIGGHYYSLKTTVETIRKEFECVVLHIGRVESPIINEFDVKVYEIIYDKFNFFKIINQINHILDLEKPDIIHSFDANAMFFAKISSFLIKKPHITTKCGGPNPQNYFPYVKDMILYSNENLDFFKHQKKFAHSNIFFIPNRITIVDQDIKRINEIKALLHKNKKIFLRISRISDDYRKTIFQSINLVKKLNENSIPCQLVLIGVIQDSPLYDEINVYKDENIFLISDPKFAINASSLIDMSDFVIGTGRGFMEAASLGKVLLAPIKESEFPLLITQENFLTVFQNNFSERSFIEKDNLNKNYANIAQVIQSENYYHDLAIFMKKMSNEYFEIDQKLNKYASIYRTLKFDRKIKIIDLIISYIMIYRHNRK